MTISIKSLLAALLSLCCLMGIASVAQGEEVSYTLDPTHTYPSFEADHMGISIWRGKFNHSTGSVTLDRANHTGTVNVSIDMNSVDFGMDKLNDWAMSKDFFDITQFPKATYVGHFSAFSGDIPTQVDGQLTLHGVTRPVMLTLNSFACKMHPMLKREWCGADAIATFRRDEFGLVAGKDYGFNMDVTLRIQVEGVKDQ